MKEKKMDMKYYIGILIAVTLAIGATAGVSIGAVDDAEINEITKTVSTEQVVENMEAKGFDVTVEDNQISAYREDFGRTVTITLDCPDGECQFQKPDREGIGKKHFRFRMHGDMDMEAVKAKMEAMGYDMGNIDMEALTAKIRAAVEAGEITAEQGRAKMGFMEQKGFEDCPMREILEQEVEE